MVSIFLINLILENRHKGEAIAYSLILGGAMGNLIDRAARGFVVDMFNVLFMHFAVFNVADICVVVGGIAAALYYLLLMDKLEGKPEGDKTHGNPDSNR